MPKDNGHTMVVKFDLDELAKAAAVIVPDSTRVSKRLGGDKSTNELPIRKKREIRMVCIPLGSELIAGPFAPTGWRSCQHAQNTAAGIWWSPSAERYRCE